MTDDAARLFDLASSPQLALLLDLDDTLVPEQLEKAEHAPLDRGFALVFEALHGVGVHVVLVSGRSMQLAGRLHDQAPHAEWVAKQTRSLREIVARLRGRSDELRVLAIRDSDDPDLVFEALEPHERAMAIRIGIGRRPSAVRAILWWLVETRRGARVHLLS